MDRSRRFRFPVLSSLILIFLILLGLGAWWGIRWYRHQPTARPTLISLFLSPARGPFPPPSGDRAASVPNLVHRTPHLNTADAVRVRQELASWKYLQEKGPVVVYLQAAGFRGGQQELFLLPAEGRMDQPASWLALAEVLEHLKQCPAREKLLVLELLPPVSGPLSGFLHQDFASALAGELARVPDSHRWVLSSCSVGQSPLLSEELGRSVFLYYFEQGLLGAADGYPAMDQKDGQVSIQELFHFVRARVDRWAQTNRAVRQSPVLFGPAEDRILAQAVSRTHAVEIHLKKAEAPSPAAGKASPGPVSGPAFSLAQAEEPGPLPSSNQVSTFLDTWRKNLVGLPLKEQGNQAEVLAGDWTRNLGKPDSRLEGAALAWLRFQKDLPPGILMGLGQVLCRSPQFAETLILEPLADLFRRGTALPSPAVERILRVAFKGERVGSKSAAFGWIRPILEKPAVLRHRAEILLGSPGQVSQETIDQAFQEAEEELDRVLDWQEKVLQAQETFHQALTFLPAWTRRLEEPGTSQKAWDPVVSSARKLGEMLARGPAASGLDASLAVKTIEALHRQSREVAQRLQELVESARSPRTSGEHHADAERCRDLLFRRHAPWFSPQEREQAHLQAQKLSLELLEQTLVMDQEEDRQQIPTPVPPHLESEMAHRQEQARLLVRARTALGLCQLCLVPEEALEPYRQALAQAAREPTPDQWLRVEQQLRRLLAEPGFSDEISSPALLQAARSFLVLQNLDPTPWEQLLARVRREEANHQWAWFSDFARYRARAYRDLNGEQSVNPGDSLRAWFFGQAAQARPEATPLSPDAAPAWKVTPSRHSLSSEQPSADFLVELQASADGQFQVLPPPPGWVQIQAETGAFQRNKAHLVHVQLPPPPTAAPIDPPEGLLVEWKSAGRVYHRRLPLTIQRLGKDVQLLIRTNGRLQTQESLSLRPGKTRQELVLEASNGTDSPRPVVLKVRTSLGSTWASHPLTLSPRETRVIPWPENLSGGYLVGPLEFRLMDGRKSDTLLDLRRLRPAVASPREYVQVTEMKYEPASARPEGKNKLTLKLQTLGKVPGPPIPVEFAFLEAQTGKTRIESGTFRGELTDQQPLVLYAENIQGFSPPDDLGRIALHVDGLPRTFLFEVNALRTVAVGPPRPDGRPAVRLLIPPFVRPMPSWKIPVQVDNPPPGARLEIALGRRENQQFRPEMTRLLPQAREQKIRLDCSPRALILEAEEQDWETTFDTARILGPRVLQTRLLDDVGQEILHTFTPVGFDETPPEAIQFVNLPAQARKGSRIQLLAQGKDDESGIAHVTFQVGESEDGRSVAAESTDSQRTLWSGELLLPETAGLVPIMVEFINGVGMSKKLPARLELTEVEPELLGLGRIVGQVVEGPRAQPGLEVVLRDEKGKDHGKARTQPDGSFAFENLAPGRYQLFCVKPDSGRRGSLRVLVEPRKTATAILNLIL